MRLYGQVITARLSCRFNFLAIRVTAVIELKPGCELDAAELLVTCRAKLGSIKAPKQILIWKQLPRSNVGKVLKKDIRAELSQKH